METFLVVVKFFGGLILLFAIGWLIGDFLKLDKVYTKMQKELKPKKKIK